MQIFYFAARSFDLHVVTDLVGKEVAVIGREHDGLDPMVGEDPNAATQVAKNSINLESRLRHVVLLTQFVNLLRGNQNQVSALNSILDSFGWFRKQVVQF